MMTKEEKELILSKDNVDGILKDNINNIIDIKVIDSHNTFIELPIVYNDNHNCKKYHKVCKICNRKFLANGPTSTYCGFCGYLTLNKNKKFILTPYFNNIENLELRDIFKDIINFNIEKKNCIIPNCNEEVFTSKFSRNISFTCKKHKEIKVLCEDERRNN